MKNTKEYHSELLSLRHKVRLSLPICIIAFSLTAILGVTLKLYTPASVVVAVIMILYFWYSRRIRSRYLEVLARSTIEHGLCRPLKGVQYRDKDGLSQAQFEALDMLPLQQEQNAFMVRHAFSGRLGGIELTGQEVTFHYAEMPGLRKTCRYLAGTLLTANMQNGTRGDWLVLHENLLTDAALENFIQNKGYVAVVAPDELEDKYLVYARQESEQLPEAMIGQIAELSALCGTLGAVRLTPQGAAVYLDRVFYTTSVYGKKEPVEADLRRNHLACRDTVMAVFRAWSAHTSRDGK